MARTDTLEHFLSDVADAIKTKKNKHASIYPDRYDTEIMSIETVNNEEIYVIPSINNFVIIPNQGYTGIGKVTVGAVTSSISVNIKPENIKRGVNILGVIGSLDPDLDTFDATAVAGDITLGKTAYVKGEKITGTNTGSVFTVPDGMKFKGSVFNQGTSLSGLDMSNVYNMSNMFAESVISEELPLFDTSNTTDMSGMFEEAVFGMGDILPLFDTSNVTTMNGMFHRVVFESSYETIPLFDTSNVTDMSYMFSESNIINVPLLDTSSVVDMSYMFGDTFGTGTAIVTLPAFNTGVCENMESMCAFCEELENVSVLNTSVCDNMYNMFYGCSSLTNTSLNNIMSMCINSAVTDANLKTLEKLGLSNSQADICMTLPNYQAFLAAGWTTGY